jgi:D-serine deaminase-like pyridoxal phosphate-dependent protein
MIGFGGGYVASGPSTRSRLPRPVEPRGLALTGREGAGEVQTPLHGSGADKLDVGDRVWFGTRRPPLPARARPVDSGSP